MALFLAVEVRLKSGEAHGAPNLAGWSPAKITAIKSWQMRSGEEKEKKEEEEKLRIWHKI